MTENDKYGKNLPLSAPEGTDMEAGWGAREGVSDEALCETMLLCLRYLRRRGEPKASQKRVLNVLFENGIMRQSELMDVMNIRSASMSELIGKLEAAGMIERRVSPMDRRNMDVRLTRMGEETARDAAPARSGALFACLSDEEKTGLYATLQKLLADWDAVYGPEDERECGRRHFPHDRGDFEPEPHGFGPGPRGFGPGPRGFGPGHGPGPRGFGPGPRRGDPGHGPGPRDFGPGPRRDFE